MFRWRASSYARPQNVRSPTTPREPLRTPSYLLKGGLRGLRLSPPVLLGVAAAPALTVRAGEPLPEHSSRGACARPRRPVAMRPRSARAKVREAQAEFERAQSQRDKASASRRESFEQAQATGLTVRDIAEETGLGFERVAGILRGGHLTATDDR